MSDPAIANAVVRSARRAYMIGVKVGQTSIFFFDAEGRQIAGFDIAVKRDLNGIREAIRQGCLNNDIRVEALRPRASCCPALPTTRPMHKPLTRSPDVCSVRALPASTAAGDKVVNAITVKGRDQINLRVTVAEMQRDVIKQLGVNLSGKFGIGSAVIDFNNTTPFPVNSGPLVDGNHVTGSFRSVNATLRAMERAGVMRTPGGAEPDRHFR